MATTNVYTDGACERNPGGRGGWGWLVDEDTFGLGGDPSSTNQRMEIRAALEAVVALPGQIAVTHPYSSGCAPTHYRAGTENTRHREEPGWLSWRNVEHTQGREYAREKAETSVQKLCLSTGNLQTVRGVWR